MPFIRSAITHACSARPTVAVALLGISAACAPSAPPVVATTTSIPERQAPPADTVAASRARAGELIATSLRALGVDAANVAPAFEIVLEARAARANPFQARRWTDTVPLAVPTRLRYLADVGRSRAMYELHSPAPGDIWFKFLTRYDTAGAWQIDLLRWRNGTDISRGPAPGARASLSAIERLMPHGALRQALRAGASLRAAGERTRDGRRAEAITYADPATNQPVTIELDAASGLPTVIATAGGASLELLEYRAVQGIQIPHRRVQRANGVASGEQRVVSVELRPDLSDARFAMPAGYTDPPPAGTPRAVQLAPGVYRLDDMPGGYHAAFVVGDSGVAVLEAPSSPAFSEAAVRVIGGIAPGKPITRVFVTHHHSDHVAGLPVYIARGAEIVLGAGLEEPVRRQMPDSLRARARFVPVTERASFGSGAWRVDAFAVPNGHAEGNIAYHLPASRILFQGDLFYIPERGGVPPAFPVTAALADAVRARRLPVERVVGVHGRTGSWREVEQSLELAKERSPATPPER